MVVHGLEETHKTDVVTAVLEARRLRYVLVRAGECLSVRHLVGKLFAGCLRTLGCESDAEEYETVDSINALAVCLEKLFRKRPAEKVVVVLDGIDDMKATSTNLGTTLLPALARLGDVVSVAALSYLNSGAKGNDRYRKFRLFSPQPPPLPSHCTRQEFPTFIFLPILAQRQFMSSIKTRTSS